MLRMLMLPRRRGCHAVATDIIHLFAGSPAEASAQVRTLTVEIFVTVRGAVRKGQKNPRTTNAKVARYHNSQGVCGVASNVTLHLQTALPFCLPRDCGGVGGSRCEVARAGRCEVGM